MRVALISLNQAWENKADNFKACRSFVQRVKSEGVDLVIFPEMTLTGFTINTRAAPEDPLESITVELFRRLAEEFDIAIVFGVVFCCGCKSTNNAILIDADGTILANYTKIHPFSFSGEDQFFQAGNEICAVRLGTLTIGLTICYDLRFPELYSALGKQCDLIINIANWPVGRIDHWNTLLKARAIENQLFVAGVNRNGTDGNGLEYTKSSMVINPNGLSLMPILAERDVDIYNIESSFIEQFRQTFSTVQDRKSWLYKIIL